MEETFSRKRRKRSMFDVLPKEFEEKETDHADTLIKEIKAAAAAECSVLDAALRVAKSLSQRETIEQVENDRLKYTHLDKDRERCEKALERNLAFVEGKKHTDYYPSSTEFSTCTKKSVSHVNISRAGIGAKGVARDNKTSLSSPSENTSCYVSGLPASYQNEPTLRRLFGQYGKVTKVKMYPDQASALIVFAEVSSVHLVIKGLNSLLLDNINISVKPMHSELETIDVSIARFDSKQEPYQLGHNDDLPGLCQSAFRPLVLLRHLYDPVQCKHSPSFLTELEAEIGQECSRYGSVLAVHAPKAHPGCVAVTFETIKAAEICVHAMNGRWFDNVQIIAERLGNWEDVPAVTDPTAHSQPLPQLDALPIELRSASLAILRNVYTADEFSGGGSAFLQGLEVEFYQECTKYGDLIAVKTLPELPEMFGSILLAFASDDARHRCSLDMDGRWFDFRRLRIQRYEDPSILRKKNDSVPTTRFLSLPLQEEEKATIQNKPTFPQEKENDETLVAFFRDLDGVAAPAAEM